MSGRAKKLLEEIHPLHIIREVQKWPGLYTRDAPERVNTHFKMKIWCEIAKALFPDWDTYSAPERDIKHLVKKWRNLRDTFKRQVEVEKRIKEGYNIKKKVYVYYNHMSFLLPHLQSDSDQEEQPSPVARPLERSAKRQAPLGGPVAAGKRPRRKPLDPPSEYVDDIDEDKHFLMSLIPSFKRMTDDEKLTAKMEILKVIKSIRSSSTMEVQPSSSGYQVVDSLAYDPDDTSEIKKEIFHEFDLAESANTDEDDDSDS